MLCINYAVATQYTCCTLCINYAVATKCTTCLQKPVPIQGPNEYDIYLIMTLQRISWQAYVHSLTIISLSHSLTHSLTHTPITFCHCICNSHYCLQTWTHNALLPGLQYWPTWGDVDTHHFPLMPS